MELWIRSQDKERLIKTEDLYIEFNGDVDPTLQSYRIVTDKFIELGIYKNKERALEVLNDIQDTLIAKYVTSLNPRAAMLETEEETTKALKKMAVYEMPLD